MKLVELKCCPKCYSNWLFPDYDVVLIQETVWIGDEMHTYLICPICGYYECDSAIAHYVEERESIMRGEK